MLKFILTRFFSNWVYVQNRIIWVFVILAQAKMLECDVIMRAVKKSTRGYKPLLRERVLAWYEGEGSERGEKY